MYITKSSKTAFSIKSFRADLLKFFSVTVANFILRG